MKLKKEDMNEWPNSCLFNTLSNVIKKCAESVEGKLNKECELFLSTKERSFVEKINKIFFDIENALDKIKKTETYSCRYGDVSFRDFCSLLEVLFSSYCFPEELKEYLKLSWGNKTRIDYGTGHELCFFLFLISFSYYSEKHIFYRSVFILFNKYIELVHKIQVKYRLEPAGSRGVWGLDDYQFLPFYFGSSQMIGRTDIPSPKDCFDYFLIEEYKKESLYLFSLYFVICTKTGNFQTHSPVLYQYANTHDWCVVKENLFQFYLLDVLCKYQAIQHICFGEIIKELKE